MIRLVDSDPRLNVISSRVCATPSSVKSLADASRVVEIKLTLDFKQFDRFLCEFEGRSDCCSCHIGTFSDHLKNDELQLIAVVDQQEEETSSLALMAHSDRMGGGELATWEIAAGEVQPADEELLKRARSIRLQQLLLRGASLRDNSDWIAEALHTVNRLRARHGAPALQWCSKAATEAHKVANNLVAAARKGKNMVCSTATTAASDCFRRGFGQAIHLPERWRVGDVKSPKAAIIDWYEQQYNPGYDFVRSGKIPGTAEFTQLVWSRTTCIGMDCDSLGQGYIVACFSPPGNINGEFSENVQPSKDAKEKSICKARFQAFDANGDNHLSHEELGHMLRTLDPSFSQNEIQFVMKAIDKNTNGRIDFDEFLNWTFPNSK
eukprot:gnl/MRDRNA2_/MRDRNA2_76303_c0_seq1.p1 gnl/MRDRNA2_/MRDRNA2_76303_c0~~gnl/MRDRNA2_/MRDRNA2_76303_c0_seq1.p1  ORF type:complete len:379 (+),score=60.11 gnl/MRDRNA2_/MRDRNA2_76303_c0_seq1:196-1332(+)